MNYIPEINYKEKNISIANNNSLTNNTFDNITNTDNVTDESNSLNYYYPIDLSYAFYDCTSLTNLEFNYFKTDYLVEISYMLFNCKGLQNLAFIGSIFSNKLIFYYFYLLNINNNSIY